MTHGSDKTMTRKELRDFGLTTGIIVAVLFGVAFPWLLSRPTPWWPWILAGCLIVWALVHAPSLIFVYKPWMRFGHIMSRITTPIILGILFFLAVLPTGLVRRLLGYDSMARRFDPDAESYRVTSKDVSEQDLEKPY
jgi:hypothetical protein